MQLGTQFVSGQCATTAIEFFGKVLKIDSEHTEAKLAFAEANIKRDEFKKISIKGEKAPVSVYEVLGINEPHAGSKKIPDTDLHDLKKHPLESARILKKMGYESDNILQMVENHHKHFDNSGYPHGKKGEEIPWCTYSGRCRRV